MNIHDGLNHHALIGDVPVFSLISHRTLKRAGFIL